MTTNDTNDASAKANFNWMIRPCDLYKEEYDECNSIKGRFQQYYVEGSMSDCTLWKQDYDNCLKIQQNESLEAAESIIQHEKERLAERMKGAAGNDVWELRSSPPEDWNSELPKDLRRNVIQPKPEDQKCAIM